MDDALRNDSGRFVPQPIANAILALIERLQPAGRKHGENGLCHCDLHPGNVIMTADGPRIIDWSMTMRGPAALDLTFGHIMLNEIARTASTIPSGRAPSMRRCRRSTRVLAGFSPAALMAAMEPWLPIVRCFVLVLVRRVRCASA